MTHTKKIKILVLALLLAFGLMLASFLAGWKVRGEKIQSPVADTIRIEKIDTVTLVGPRDTLTRIVLKSYPVAVHDTIVRGDTMFVTLPYEHRFMSKEDTLEIWYSGIDPKIDSAKVYMHHTTEIVKQPYEVTVMKEPVLTFDVGIGNHQWQILDPYVFARATINANKWKIEPYAGYTYSRQPMFGVTVSRCFTLIK